LHEGIQKPEQDVQLRLGKSLRGFSGEATYDAEGLGSDGLASFGEKQPRAASVVGVRLSADDAVTFEPSGERRERGLVRVEHAGDVGERAAVVLRDVIERGELRHRDPERFDRPGVGAREQCPMGTVHQKEKSAIGGHVVTTTEREEYLPVNGSLVYYMFEPPTSGGKGADKKMNNFQQFILANARAFRDEFMGAALTGGTSLRALSVWQRLSSGSSSLAAAVSGRSVLVTGASSGIGRAVALKLGDAGATVLLVARSDEKLRVLAHEMEQRGGRARPYPADLSSRASADELLSRLAADRVTVDVLINNAGRSIRRPVEESYGRIHDFERTMAINYFGSLRLILGLLPEMRARRIGHVINVSTAGVQVGTPLFSAYIASKAALDAFTRIAGAEARSDGVRFSTVHMPLVRTPMIAPTPAFRDAPALTPEEAADLVLRPLVTHEKELGTWLGRLFHVAHVLAPDLSEQVVSAGHRSFRDAARGSKQSGDESPPFAKPGGPSRSQD
jgi:NAD(P)-dependent dehydrogenase (short-subunit alcohol dehydrogenase family)